MSGRDVTTESGDQTASAERGEARVGRPPVSKPPRFVRWTVESGTVAAVGGGAALVGGLRALRRGDYTSAFVRLLVGGLLATVAVAQRRSGGRAAERSDVDQTDVVDTAPDVEGVAPDTGGPRRATDEEARDAVGTTVDIEDLEEDTDDATVDAEGAADSAGAAEGGTGEEPIPDEEGSAGEEERTAGEVGRTAGEEKLAPGEQERAEGEDETLERLGEAAFDGQSGRAPAPQEAFNRNILSTGTEAFWGVREADGSVVVSQAFDPIQDAEGVEYVASSEVDDEDREVRVPDTVLNHWDDLADGGTAVVSGTGLVFAISDALQQRGQVLVVPAQWADEVLGDAEE